MSDKLIYKNALYLVRCGACEAKVWATAQKHGSGSGDKPINIVWHKNYCECGKKLIEKTDKAKRLDDGEAYFTIIETPARKKKKRAAKEKIVPLFDKNDDSLYTIRPRID